MKDRDKNCYNCKHKCLSYEEEPCSKCIRLLGRTDCWCEPYNPNNFIAELYKIYETKCNDKRIMRFLEKMKGMV